MKQISFYKKFTFECSERMAQILMVVDTMMEQNIEFPEATKLVAEKFGLTDPTVRAKFTRGLKMPTNEVRKLISQQLLGENNNFKEKLLKKSLNDMDVEAILKMI